MSDPGAATFFAQRLWGAVGGVVAGIAVAIGAFGTPGVERALVEVHASAEPEQVGGLAVPASYRRLRDFETGVDCQLAHGLAIISTALLGRRGLARVFAHAAAGCFAAGVVLFCGPLYLLATTGIGLFRTLSMIGAAVLVVGWVLFVVAVVLPRTGGRRD